MKTELQSTLDQLLEAARSEGRQEVRDAVLAALGAEKTPVVEQPHEKPATNGHGANGNGRARGLQQAIALALAQKPGSNLNEISDATGHSSGQVANALHAMRVVGKVRKSGKPKHYRYFRTRKA